MQKINPKPLIEIHPIEQQILLNLATAENLHFNQIKTFETDPKNFVYHLKKLITNNLVDYNPETTHYTLSTKGKQLIGHYGINPVAETLPVSVFIGLYIELNNKILTVTRKTAPYLNYTGIPTFTPTQSEFIHETAQKELAKLGLQGKLTRPLIIETLYKDTNNNPFTHSHMHVFYCTNPTGQAINTNEEGTLTWLTPQELLSQPKGYQDSKTLINFFKTYTPDQVNTQIISKIDQTTGL